MGPQVSRNYPPEVRTTLIADWPEADREAWYRAIRKGGVLDEPGRGAEWAPATEDRYARAYGHFLTYLRFEGVLDPDASPADRVTPDIVAAFVTTLEKRITARTVASYLEALNNTLWAMAPDRDWAWLREIVNRLKHRASLSNSSHAFVPPIDELFRAGIKLMEEAARRTPRRPLQDSIWFRDGLMIALLAATLLRRRNLASLEFGVHLVRQPESYLLCIPAAEVKNRRPIEGLLPDRLTPLIDRYVEFHRPRLLQGRATDAVWITNDGQPMPINAVGQRIIKVTRRIFGTPVSPHRFRHAAATTIATDDPTHTMIIRSLLAHTTHGTAERFYNLAQMIDAGRRHSATIARLRTELREASEPGDQLT